MKTLKIMVMVAALVAAECALAATKYRGMVTDGFNRVGVCEMTVGKANKNGLASAKGKITIGSKKYSLPTVKIDADYGVYEATVKKLGDADLTLSDGTIDGTVGDYSVEAFGEEEEIGMGEGEFVCTVDGWLDYDGNGDVVDLLPDGEPVHAYKNKWKTDKAGSLKLQKAKGQEPQLVVKGTTNTNGLKLSYNHKKGTFSGSFKAWVLNYDKNYNPKSLKAYSFKIKGYVGSESATGLATNKKLGELEVTIE